MPLGNAVGCNIAATETAIYMTSCNPAEGGRLIVYDRRVSRDDFGEILSDTITHRATYPIPSKYPGGLAVDTAANGLQ